MGKIIFNCPDFLEHYIFGYILIKDITCTEEAAKELAKHLKGMICKLNLIPYNPVQEFPQPPTHDEMQAFKRKLKVLGIHATLRAPRGRDISVACGRYAILRSRKKGLATSPK